ncbi:cell division protein FtsJ [Polychytrium aggregatum]|uniref:cell division protein FtsJ n=1 Tax=Polychytrium aggregatum TaxID=110093 RepID=UPI0022FEC287|nr:cell division protein FtsJ [Polychytrium aggregatum]KAI9202253.1 cell division protein FtsJ [Polychytrium aggregatum]
MRMGTPLCTALSRSGRSAAAGLACRAGLLSTMPCASMLVPSRAATTKQWLRRQISDPFVRQAVIDNYRSRAAFKLDYLAAKHRLFREGMVVLDLGACPGGWSQVAARCVAASEGEGIVVSVDLQPIDPIPGVHFIQADVMSSETLDAIEIMIANTLRNRQAEVSGRGSMHRISDIQAMKAQIGSPAKSARVVDVVLSDMAPAFSGNRTVDVTRTTELCEMALTVANRLLKKKGSLVCKFLQGESFNELRALLEAHFETVMHVKPPASRKESTEMFLVCLKFKGPTAAGHIEATEK